MWQGLSFAWYEVRLAQQVLWAAELVEYSSSWSKSKKQEGITGGYVDYGDPDNKEHRAPFLQPIAVTNTIAI